MEKRLLLIDDEPGVCKSLNRLLRRDGYQIRQATSPFQALDILEEEEIDVIISDQRMPEMTGSEFFARVSREYPETVRMILSGYADFDAIMQSVNEGSIYKFLCKPWDNDELREQVRKAFQSRRILKENIQGGRLFDMSSEGMLVTDSAGIITSANPAALSITGFKLDELLGTNFFTDNLELSKTRKFMRITQTVAATGEWRGGLCMPAKTANQQPQQVLVKRHERSEGVRDGYTILFTGRPVALIDSRDQEDSRVTISKHGQTEFTRRVNSLMKSESGETASSVMLVCRISHFEHAVETVGRSSDVKLQEALFERLDDATPKDCLISHICNGQLVLFSPAAAHPAAFNGLMQKIQEAFRAPFNIDGCTLFASLHIGAADYENRGENVTQWIDNAARAAAKAWEKGLPVHTYHASINEELQERLLLEQALYKAVDNHEFALHYQPKIDLASGEVRGLEALIRWTHAVWGNVPPAKFIPVAERNGLIHDIGRYVIEQACKDVKEWHRAGYSGLSLAVNLSPMQITDTELPNFIRATLENNDFPADKLELEITESVLIECGEPVSEFMRQLRQVGVHFAADDFGTGYSGLGYIKQYPFTSIKIDKLFIDDMLTDSGCKSIVTSVIDLAKSLRLDVVAEGVEDADQALFLDSIGCDQIQGYFYSKPLENDQFVAFLQKRARVHNES